MFDFTHFTAEEQRFLAERLEGLLKDDVITGINTYAEVIDLDVCLPLSYLHHSTKHEAHLKHLMQQKKRLKQIAETWKKREKQAIYRWDQAWQIKPEEKQLGIEFYILGTAQKFDADAVARAERLSDIYSGNEMVVTKDKGYDLNFSIDSRLTLIALLNLFRKHASPILLDKDGLPEMDELDKSKPNPDAIPEAYSVPVIIYKDRFNLLKGPIRGFKPVHKIAFIRNNDELSFYIDQACARLMNNSAFQELRSKFEKDYVQTTAFGNTLFVNYLNQETQ